MTNNLRDRIKAALKASNDRVAGFIGYDEMADAVIAELGLREEKRTNPMSSAGCTVNTLTGERKWHSDIRHDRRYVTEWETDE